MITDSYLKSIHQFINKLLAGVAQLVERHPSKVNVAGSNPVARSVPFGNLHASRYSSGVEHFHGKEGVVGSNPTNGSCSVNIIYYFIYCDVILNI